MSNRSLFSIALFFSLSLPVLAETPPVTTPVKTEQAPEVKAPEAPNGNTATPATLRRLRKHRLKIPPQLEQKVRKQKVLLPPKKTKQKNQK